MTNLLVTLEEGPRPAGKPDECFYCYEKLGKHHLDDCPFVTKIVKIRATVEFDYECPRIWDKRLIESYFNESSRCMGDLPAMLQDHMKLNDTDCLCECVTCELVE